MRQWSLRKIKPLHLLFLLALISVGTNWVTRKPYRRVITHGKKHYEAPKIIKIAYFEEWRENFLNFQSSKDPSGLVRGVFLGEDRFIDNENRERFKDAGLSHLLAASGFNCWIVAQALGLVGLFIFRQLGKNLNTLSYYRGKKNILPLSRLFGAWLFWFWSDQSPPITRSSVLISIKFVLEIFGYHAPFSRILTIQYLLFLIVTPRYFWNASFQLTFFCLFGIAILPDLAEKFLGKWLKPIPHFLRTYFLSTMGAGLGAMPITWIFFDEIHLTSLFTNFWAIPIASFGIMPAGLAQMLLCEPHFAQITGTSHWVNSVLAVISSTSASILDFCIAWWDKLYLAL